MSIDLAEKMIEDFEEGILSRRQLAQRLLGLAAVLAGARSAAADETDRTSTFRATGLDHVALNVSKIPRSRDFYVRHLGLEVVREGKGHCFLGRDGNFLLALFQREPVGLNHYCYTIRDYAPNKAVHALDAAGLRPRREQDRVYFDDPDGVEVQIAAP
jgi:catechol 2,3-dioxygenase-like lactoylglutathione lyase family enzyme